MVVRRVDSGNGGGIGGWSGVCVVRVPVGSCPRS